MNDLWRVSYMLADLIKELEEKKQKTQKQMWEEHAIEELKEYFALPYAIQKKYAPMYSPGLMQFLYLENVSEKINERKLIKEKLDKGKLSGDVLRTKDGRLFTLEDIKIKENIK